jgi:hypothetical protein
MTRNTIEFYEEAIDKLEIYTANEMDELKVEQAEDKISSYRHKIMDSEWNKITQRTARLNDLKADLQAVIDGADVLTIGGGLSGLTSLVGELGEIADVYRGS